MATATQTQRQPNGATTHEVAKSAPMVVEAKLTSGIFKGKMVDLTIAPDGSAIHMSDPKITPQEREAWDWLMQITRDTVATAEALRAQTEQSKETMKLIRSRLNEEKT